MHATGGLDESDVEFLCDEVDNSDSDIEFEGIFPKPDIVIVKSEENSGYGEHHSTQSTEHVEQSEPTGDVSSTNLEQSSEGNKETDVLSGSIAFTENEVGDRYYTDFDAAIRYVIVKCLIGWNTTHPFNTFFYDKLFIGVLLKEVLMQKYSEVGLNDKRIVVIKPLFDVQVKDDDGRRKEFNVIVKEKQDKAKGKTNESGLSRHKF